MYIVNIASTIKKMWINEPIDFIFENYYKQIGFVKERSYCDTFEKKKICCGSQLKSVTIEHPNTSHKKFWNKKNIKITKRAHSFKGYAISHNVEIINSFNPELQLKDTKSPFKN